MGAIIRYSLNLDKLDKSKVVKGKKGTYYDLTISVNDEISQFGDNVSIYDTQSKEERQAKKARNYVGNGKVVWTDGNIQAVPSQGGSEESAYAQQVEEDSALPF